LFEPPGLIGSAMIDNIDSANRQWRLAMLREQTINFLQAVIVFLLLTNAVSVVVTVYAMRLANALSPGAAHAMSAVERRIEGMVRRAT
jgi:hypothetical protein